MNQEQERIMKVIDDNGKEVEMYILFTTSLPDFEKNYIFYLDPKDQSGQVYVSSYDENNKLAPVENDAEWEQLEEVFNQFAEEMSNNQCGNCQGECDDCDGECEGNCQQ